MRKILTIVAMMALAGCGGGGGGGSAPVSNPQPTATPTAVPGGLVTPTFALVMTPRTNSSGGRAPQFVSSAVKSVTITITNPPAGLSPTSVSSTITPPCTSGSPCSVNGPPSPPGRVDNFSITTYDGPVVSGAATGNALDTDNGTTSLTPTAGQNNPVSVTLMGIPFSIAIAPLTAQAVDTAGQTQTVAVTVADHSGQTITGTYSQSVRITDPDPATYSAGVKGTMLTGTHNVGGCTCVDMLTSTDTATLTYRGLAEDPVTLTSSATGVSGGNAGTATFTPILQPIAANSGFTNPTTTYSGGGIGIDLFTTDSGSNVGYTGVVSYTEPGYTDTPYNKQLATIAGTSCAAFATESNVSNPPSGTPGNGYPGTNFTYTAAANSAGVCTRVVSDGLAAAGHGTGGPSFKVTYTTSSVNASSKKRQH